MNGNEKRYSVKKTIDANERNNIRKHNTLLERQFNEFTALFCYVVVLCMYAFEAAIFCFFFLLSFSMPFVYQPPYCQNTYTNARTHARFHMNFNGNCCLVCTQCSNKFLHLTEYRLVLPAWWKSFQTSLWSFFFNATNLLSFEYSTLEIEMCWLSANDFE